MLNIFTDSTLTTLYTEQNIVPSIYYNNIKGLYIGMTNKNDLKQYRDILLSMPALLPEGIEISFSFDKLLWGTKIDLGILGHNPILLKYIKVYRRIKVSTNTIFNLEDVKYKLEFKMAPE